MQKEEVEIYENIGWGGMSICNNCKECLYVFIFDVFESLGFREVRRPKSET